MKCIPGSSDSVSAQLHEMRVLSCLKGGAGAADSVFAGAQLLGIRCRCTGFVHKARKGRNHPKRSAAHLHEMRCRHSEFSVCEC